MPRGLSVRGILNRRRALFTTAARSLSRPRPPYSTGHVEKNQPESPSRSHQSATSSASRARRSASASPRSMASTHCGGRLARSHPSTSAARAASSGPGSSTVGLLVGRPAPRPGPDRRPLGDERRRSFEGIGVAAMGDEPLPPLLHGLAEREVEGGPHGALGLLDRRRRALRRGL